MTQRFTTDGGAELEKRLDQWCAGFAAELRSLIPENVLEAVVLGGGYGRGEGGVLKTAAGEQPYNDLEFYVFVRGPLLVQERRFKKALSDLCHRWTEKTGIEFESKLMTFEKLERARVSMFYYDLVIGHRWLYGAAGEFHNCEHHHAAHRIPLEEAARLLMNRSSGLLYSEVLLQKANFSAEDADFVRRNISKAQLALGDVVLAAFGRYHASCRERHRRLEKLEAPIVWLPEVVHHHETGVQFKIHPYRSTESAEDLRHEHAKLTKLAGEVFLWLEQRRLGKSFPSHKAYALDPVQKHPDRRALRNFLINVKTFGANVRSTRYPRERLLEALALLLWTPGAISDPETAQTLASLLLPVRGESNLIERRDFSSFVAAYRALWNRFN